MPAQGIPRVAVAAIIAAFAATAAACDGSPADVPQVRQVIAGDARLTGSGQSSCSHGQPLPGASARPGATDRWCAFSQPRRSNPDPKAPPDHTELWVVDVTKVAEGVPVTCDGKSPHCRLLTTNLWTAEPDEGPNHPFAHRFDGDTLLFHADALSLPDELYEGPVYAWRPGWPQPRVISTARGITCAGHERAAVAVCLDNLSPENVMPVQFDLLAGALTPDARGPLPKADRVIPFGTANRDIRWRQDFSPDGSLWAFSMEQPGTKHEILRVFRTGEIAGGKPATVLLGAVRWRFSRDGKKVYFLQDFNYDDEHPAGTLTMADLPLGTNVQPLVPRVGGFLLLGEDGVTERGVGFLQDMHFDSGAFRILRDRSRPEELVTIAFELDDVMLSKDGRFTHYVAADASGMQSGQIARNDGSGSCVLSAKPGNFTQGTTFLESSGLVFWGEEAEDEEAGTRAWLASPDACSGKTSFANHLVYLDTDGDRGVLWGEDLADPGPDERDLMTLKYARLDHGRAFPKEGGVVVRAKVDDFISPPGPGRNQIVFQSPAGTPAESGIFVYGPLPPAAR